MRRLATIVFVIVICQLSIINSVNAQSKWAERFDRFDSLLAKRYAKGGYDTAYISRPEQKLTLKLRINGGGNTIEVKSDNLNGMRQEANFSTAMRMTMSIGASYRGLGVSLGLNPAKWSGKNKDFVLNLRYYTSFLSVDASYQDSKTLHGELGSGESKMHIDAGDVRLKTFLLSAYYTFNYRKFSMPAAFMQSYIQKRSAGSWLAGISYEGGSLKTDRNEEKGIPQSRTYIGNFAIGGGYAHNFVTNNQKWLFHFSLIPNVIIVNRNNITVEDERKYVGYKFPEMIFVNRFAVVYNINKRNFISMTTHFNITAYRASETKIVNNRWNAHICYGWRM